MNSVVRKTLSSRFVATTALGALLTPAASATLCEDKGDDKPVWDKFFGGGAPDGAQITDAVFWDNLAKEAGRKVQGAIDSGVPTQLSYGFVSGYCSGLALKKAGRAVSVVLGLGFVSLQTLSYYGYVKVDHSQLGRDFQNMMDLNEDGKVDSKDVELATQNILKVLEFNLPAGSGFAAGFFGGIRSG